MLQERERTTCRKRTGALLYDGWCGMDITKSTLWGALALVVLAIGILAVRSHLLAERAACGKQLAALVPRLAQYAMTHQGHLPPDAATLRQAVGTLSTPYTLASEPLKWKRPSIKPYLWDPQPHPYLNGIHVLATDGKVYLVDNLREVGQEGARRRVQSLTVGPRASRPHVFTRGRDARGPTGYICGVHSHRKPERSQLSVSPM